MVIESCLGCPADIHGGGDVGTCPLEDGGNLLPVGHFLKGIVLYGCTGDNHTIKLLMFHLLEIAVEHHHVLYRSVLGRMALELHKTDVQLQWGVREHTHEIGLSSYLQGHEVEDSDAQRTDILCGGTGIVHHKDILFLQQLYRWQQVG